MKKKFITLLLTSLFAFLVCSVQAQNGVVVTNTGSALKDDSIRDEPFRDAKVVCIIEKGGKVEIIRRDGGWYRVKSDKGNGWVRMLSIRRASSEQPRLTAEGILNLASGRAGTGKVVMTTGIRGISEEDLKTAKFDEKQLGLLESYVVSRVQASQFAAMGRLKARAMAYLQAEDAR